MESLIQLLGARDAAFRADLDVPSVAGQVFMRTAEEVGAASRGSFHGLVIGPVWSGSAGGDRIRVTLQRPADRSSASQVSSWKL